MRYKLKPTLSAGVLVIGAALCALVFPVQAQTSTADSIARYRELLQDDNPADLWVARGEELWKQKRGPKNVTLEACDLGKGPGVIAGAYAELPRFFPDANRVQDLEARLAYCMVNLQGYSYAEATKTPFGNGSEHSDFESLTAYIVTASQGFKVLQPMQHPKERESYLMGEKMFYFRAGTHDFSCATCHSQDGKRIRLQDVPNLTHGDDARGAYTTWPAYRVSQGEFRTMQWRMNDCLRQQRLPNLIFNSDASIALISFLAKNAEGGSMNAPGMKR